MLSRGGNTVTRSGPEWVERASCRFVVDPDIFFMGDTQNVKLARQVCANCPVSDKCAKELWDDPYAIVAGLTPRDRQRLDKV